MWIFEISLSVERFNQKLALLRQDFPRLEKLAMAHFFCVVGCLLPMPLNEHEKAILEGYIEQGMIYRFRCGRQK